MAFESIANAVVRLYSETIRLPHTPTESEQLADSIRKARSELERAESLFNEITNHEMVDCLSYDIMAAKARYSGLLRAAKETRFENHSL